jgi:teichuronic acid biosynthesis glycosyltransferase TuaG
MANESKGPIVSIVLPTYNREEYLAEAVKSIIGQTLKDWELIVIDDASMDSTYKLMEYFCQLDNRIRYFRLPKNAGISVARNTGVNLAKGKYVAVMDSDDVASPSRLKKSLRILEQGFDMVYSSYLQADETGRVVGMVTPKPANKLNMREILETQMVPHVTMMGKKELFEYNTEYRSNDDLWLVSKLFHDGVSFKMIKEPLMIVRYHGDSTSVTKSEEIEKITKSIKDKYGKEETENGTEEKE